MNTSRILTYNTIEEIKKNTIVQKDTLLLNNDAELRKKYSYDFHGLIDEIDTKIARSGQIPNEETSINTELKHQEDGIKALSDTIATMRQANPDDPNLENHINQLKELENEQNYKENKKKQADIAKEKKQNLVDIRDNLQKLLNNLSPNIKRNTQDDIKKIQNKIKDLSTFIAGNDFSDNAKIASLINDDDLMTAIDNQSYLEGDFGELKIGIIKKLNQRIINSKDGRKAENLLRYFQFLTQDNKNNKLHKEIIKKLKKFTDDGNYGEFYEYISENIDLASLADGIIKIYYDGRDLTDKYKKLLVELDAAKTNKEKLEIQTRLKQKFEEIEEFNKKYRINFGDISKLNTQNIKNFDIRRNNFLNAIENKFGIEIDDHLQTIEYLGLKPSLTQKANIFKTIEEIDGDYIPDSKFWKSKGCFLDQDKKWYQFKDKNGELIGSRILIRTGCTNPFNQRNDCMRIFYDDGMRSCVNQLVKHKDFKNKTILEGPAHDPKSWIATFTTVVGNNNEKGIIKTFSNNKMATFLDDIPGFFVALSPYPDPNDNTKTILKPTLFYNDNYKDIIEEKGEKYNKLMKKVKTLYKDYRFTTYDPTNQQKISHLSTIDDLVTHAKYMKFDEKKNSLTNDIQDVCSKASEKFTEIVSQAKSKVVEFCR